MNEFCEADMDNRFCQLNVAKASGASGGGVAAGLAFLAGFKGLEPAVHQSGYNRDYDHIDGHRSLNVHRREFSKLCRRYSCDSDALEYVVSVFHCGERHC